jgi:hypothetical protein
MKNLLAIVFFFLFFAINNNAQIKVITSGYVGINNSTPSYQLDVTGSFRVAGSAGCNLMFQNANLYTNISSSTLGNSTYLWGQIYARYAYFYYTPIIYSDAKLKFNVRNMPTMTEKLMQLKPCIYNMYPPKDSTSNAANIQTAEMKIDQIGFLAQDVQKVFPELVSTDDKGTLGVKYVEMIPILVKAIQEQQEEIKRLKGIISNLKGK